MQITAPDRAALLAVIDRFPRRRIILLGDLVADEFVCGEISRVSREAPVLILKQRERRIVPGGGANAANNLADLDARIIVAGVVGRDEAGEALLKYFGEKGVPTALVRRRADYPTPTKSRILGVLGHGHPQQIVRVDREPDRLPVPLRRRLSRSLLPHLRQADALLFSDYGYGAASAAEAEFLRQHAKRLGREDLIMTVDSRYDVRTYRGLTASTPNEPEVEQAFGQRIGDNLQTLDRLARRLLHGQALAALLVTRGREGMVLYEPRRAPRRLPIFGSDEVADVTGAGDTVIAVFTLALASGASKLHAAMLANCAGGLVVMKSGTATVSRRELAEAIRNA